LTPLLYPGYNVLMPSAVQIAVFAPLRAALFDLDGTLVETHIDFLAMTRAMRELALSAGVPEEVFRGKDILGMSDAAADFVTQNGGDGPALRQTAHALLEEMEVVGCAHPTLLPGTHALLTALRAQGRKIGIVTRNCRRVSTQLVSRFALPHDVLLSRDDVKLAKPHPEHLWEALRVLETAPRDAVMVGDHWMDVQAAHAAGCAATLGVLGAHGAAWFVPCPPTALVTDLQAALPLFPAMGR
jgi:phosphoglycolate phosphatase